MELSSQFRLNSSGEGNEKLDGQQVGINPILKCLGSLVGVPNKAACSRGPLHGGSGRCPFPIDDTEASVLIDYDV